MESNDSTGVGPIPREGAAVKLVPLVPEAAEFLYHLATDEDVGWRWSFAGAVPRRDIFEHSLWSGVLAQFLVVEKLDGGLIGTVRAYGADLNHGYTYASVGMIEAAAGSGMGIEAIDLFVAHIFACYRIRKIYFEVAEYNLSQFESAIGWLVRQEGNMADHTYYRGQYWDKIILALYREDYELVRPEDRRLGRRRRLQPASETRV